MELIEDLDNFSSPSYSVVTSGTFDGVHIGHQKILSRMVQLAKQHNGKSIVLTLWPHPRYVLHKNSEQLKLLTTFEEKVNLLSRTGIDYIVKIPFTSDFSQLSSRDFINKILIKGLNTKKLVIGYDHRFGKNREGSFEYLSENAQDFGFEIEEISRQDIEHIGVSSTLVRGALTEGDVELASNYLGRNYCLNGFVKEGDRIGRSIGFPTANIDVPETYKLIPADGAYAARVTFEGKIMKAMLNVGWRPTVSGHERRIEVNIFNFDADIYNQRLTIEFVRKLRREIKFDGIDKLKEQLIKDKELALNILKNE